VKKILAYRLDRTQQKKLSPALCGAYTT